MSWAAIRIRGLTPSFHKRAYMIYSAVIIIGFYVLLGCSEPLPAIQADM